MAENIVLSAPDLRRTLARIAHEIIERNQGTGSLVLVGMHTRGVPLARRLAANIRTYENIDLPVGTLDISQHRDDLASRENKPVVKSTDIPVSVDGQAIILIDDVLYTGRTTRAALEGLMAFGRPATIQLAILVDRGFRELPIQPDYVGKNKITSVGEEIRVKLKEVDDEDCVLLVKAPDSMDN